MATPPVLSDIANLQNETTAVNTINQNTHLIEDAFEGTVSRFGTTPNQMEADFDMNSNRILNLPAASDLTEPVRKAEFDAAVLGDLDGVVTESNLSFSDNVLQDVSILKHGLAPKLPNDATRYLNGIGTYTVPPGTGGGGGGAVDSVNALTGALTISTPTHRNLKITSAGTDISIFDQMNPINPLSYGATFDGVTDDTAAMNAMIADINAAGKGYVVLPAGTCQVTTLTPLTAPSMWQGSGQFVSKIRTTATTGDVIRANNQLTMRDFGMDSSVTRTSGAFLNLAANFCMIQNFEFNRPYIGVTSGGTLNRLMHGDINLMTSRNVSANSGGVRVTDAILSCFDVAVGSATNVNNDMAEFGFDVVQGELDMTQCFVFQTNAGVKVTPASGKVVLGVNMKGCWFDTTISYGLNCSPAAGSIVNYIWASDCWFAPGSNGANGYGIVMDNTAGGTMTKNWFCNNYINTYSNGNGIGVYLYNPFGSMETNFTGNMVGGIGTGFAQGFQVLANTSGLVFTGNNVSGCANAMTIAAGASNFIVNGNRFQNNSGGLSDSSGAVAKVVANNL